MSDRINRKQTLGGCRLVREIGRGGMGVVYEAEDESTGARVAVKVLPAFQALDQARASRFLEEARTASKLVHPNIVRVHRIGSEEGSRYIVMDFVDGKPLDSFWKERIIDHRTAAELVLQCAQALEYAHRNGVVHLDVNPRNILVEETTGKAFIADFGLAHVQGSGREGGESIAGTPRYMSPEQAMGRRDVDLRSDVFSLGVTLYNLATSAHPFDGSDVHLILENVISCDFRRPRDLNPKVPSALEAIILKAMEKSPERRYQSMLEMASDLRGFLEGESVTASVPILKRRGFRLLRVKYTWYALLLASLAALAALYLTNPPFMRPREGQEQKRAGGDAASEARLLSEKGDSHFRDGEIGKAREFYDRALALNPDDSVTLDKRGQIFSAVGDFGSALSDFDSVLSRNPDFIPVLRNRAEALMELGRLAEARRDLERALDALRRFAPGGSAEDSDLEAAKILESGIRAGLGRLHFLSKNNDLALEELSRASELDSSNARARLYAGLVYLERKDFERAKAEMAAAMKGPSRDRDLKTELERLKNEVELAGIKAQFNRLQAAVHLERGLYAKAAGFASEALDINPVDADALIIRGKALFGLARYENAALDFGRAAETSQSPAEAFALRSRARRYLGFLKEAVEDGRQAVEKDGSMSLARRELGLSLLEIGRRAEAVVHLAAAVEAQKEDIEAARSLMDACVQTDNRAMASWAAAAVLAIDPGDRNARILNARSMIASGLHKQAIAELDKATGGGTAEIRLMKARILILSGEHAAALDLLGGAGNLSPAEEKEAARCRADALKATGRHAEYLDALGRYMELAQKDEAAWIERAGFLLSRGEFERALADYERAAELRPDSESALDGAARSALGAGKLDRAAAHAARAVSIRKTAGTLATSGRVALAEGRPDGALEDFREARKMCRQGDLETDSLISLGEARALHRLCKPAEALEAVEECAGRGAAGRDVQRYRIEILLDLDRNAEAQAALASYISRNRADGFASYASSRIEYSSRRYARALAALEGPPPAESVEEDGVPLARGRALFMLGRLAEAGKDLDRALALDDSVHEAWFMSGRIRESEGEIGDAVKCYGRAIALKPDSALYLSARGAALERTKGGASAADADLSKAIELSPRESDLRFHRASLRRRAGNLDSARSDLRAALELRPNHPEYIRALAEVEEASGAFESALEAVGMLPASEPQAPLMFDRARILLKLRRFAESAAEAEKVRSAGGVATTLQGKAMLIRAEAFIGLEDFQQAVSICTEAAEKHPAIELPSRILRGEAYLLRGCRIHGLGAPNEDYVRAYHDINSFYLRAVEGALDVRDSARVRMAMGLYQWIAEKDAQKALSDLRAASELDPESAEPYRRIGLMAAEGLWPAVLDAGLEALRKARGMGHRDRAGIAFDLGRILRLKGMYAEACEEFRKAVNLDPGRKEAWKELKACENMIK